MFPDEAISFNKRNVLALRGWFGGALEDTADEILTLREITDDPNVLIYSISYHTTGVADNFLQVFDADKDNVILGTTEPDFVIKIENSAVAPIYPLTFTTPLEFKNGYTIASTTTETGSTPATASVVTTYASQPARQ